MSILRYVQLEGTIVLLQGQTERRLRKVPLTTTTVACSYAAALNTIFLCAAVHCCNSILTSPNSILTSPNSETVNNIFNSVGGGIGTFYALGLYGICVPSWVGSYKLSHVWYHLSLQDSDQQTPLHYGESTVLLQA